MKNKSGRRVSIIVVLAIFSLISILAINAIATAIKNKRATEQSENISESISVYDEAIAENNNKLSNENEEKNLEDKAREDGYIYPDEIVYADSAN